MAFSSKWLDWGKEPDSELQAEPGSSVSSVSSLNIENRSKTDNIEINSSFNDMPYCQNSEICPDLCVQRTDKTDKTPSSTRNLDGHAVNRIVWETAKAVIFRDESGRFWRYLHAYGKAWPVIVEGQR